MKRVADTRLETVHVTADDLTTGQDAALLAPNLLLTMGVWSALLPLTALRAGPLGTLGDALMLIVGPHSLAVLLLHRSTRAPANALVLVSVWLTASVVIMSSLHAIDIAASATGVLKVAFGLLLIGAACMLAVKHPLGACTLVHGYLAGSMILAASTWVVPHSGRATGLAGHPVEIGVLLSVAVAMATFIELPKRYQLLRPAALIVLCSAFATSLSLTGVLVSGISVFIIGVLGRRFTVRGATGVGIVAYVLWRLANSTWGPALTLMTKINLIAGSSKTLSGSTLGDNDTAQARLTTMRFGWERIKQHPITGSGLDEAGQLAVQGLAPHNVLVLSWQSGGIVLLAVLVALLLATARAVLHLADSDPLGRAVAAGAVAAWLGAMSGPDIYRRSWLLPVLLALALAAHRRKALHRQGAI